MALMRHPAINASLSADGEELILHGAHNIGVAMASPAGLVVPNLKAVQQLSVADIAIQLQNLQSRAMANQLTQADVTGGTITISNIGELFHDLCR